MLKSSSESYCTMPELADMLVREAGVSFRQIREITGTVVKTTASDG